MTDAGLLDDIDKYVRQSFYFKIVFMPKVTYDYLYEIANEMIKMYNVALIV